METAEEVTIMALVAAFGLYFGYASLFADPKSALTGGWLTGTPSKKALIAFWALSYGWPIVERLLPNLAPSSETTSRLATWGGLYAIAPWIAPALAWSTRLVKEHLAEQEHPILRGFLTLVERHAQNAMRALIIIAALFQFQPGSVWWVTSIALVGAIGLQVVDRYGLLSSKFSTIVETAAPLLFGMGCVLALPSLRRIAGSVVLVWYLVRLLAKKQPQGTK